MDPKAIRQIHCPSCRKTFRWVEESAWRPFCSERCRLIDLGEWLDEGYRLADDSDQMPIKRPVE